ncbi:hypothetical protein KBZ10_00695 [Streptomyces sp. F63]|uniref:DUF6461 domain-containing protein n=1 Tax=Streptomyces sp. F63 TaxID=2824887 RepID=UPI001B376308|nr:DUF6461 domain-containing protein [Streptomyces sp. F63]MBQ0983080.1 hypothetical protein [Streptomyces sp. F63]
MWDGVVARYAWADANEIDSYTASVITGKTEDEVIRAFGGDPVSSRVMTFDEAAEEQADHLYEDHNLLLVVTAGQHVITVECGYYGSIPEIARRASVGGEFFSVYSSVNGHYQVMHAVDGRVDGAFDPFEMEDAAWMDPQPQLPAWAQEATFHLGSVEAESFALMERTMGVAFNPAWLETPLRTVLLPAPAALFGDSEAAWQA